MKTPDIFTKACLMAIILLLATVAIRQTSPSSVMAADGIEYFFHRLPDTGDMNSLEISELLNFLAAQLNGNVHSISFAFGAPASVVFEVPKGTTARMRARAETAKNTTKD